MGTEVTGGPTAVSHAKGAFVPKCQGNSLHPCSPSPMRAHLGGVWQPWRCSSGNSEVELGTEVPSGPPAAGEDYLGDVDFRAQKELVDWWQD